MDTSSLHFAVGSHVGLRRDHNEDAHAEDPALGLWIVADGMGGHDAGELASQLACELIAEEVRRGSPLTNAVRQAHEVILLQGIELAQTMAMGTTVVALRSDGREFEVAWVGDARAYLFDGNITQLTRDHSYVEDLLQHGLITRSEARDHPQRNIVTQALGVVDAKDLAVGSRKGRWKPGHRVLLCSDGLTDAMAESAIESLLRDHRGSLESLIEALIDGALAGGGPDNITVAVIEHP